MPALASPPSTIRSRLFWSWVLLTLAVLIVAAPVRMYLGSRFGQDGVTAVWIGVGLCWAAGSLTLLLHAVLRKPELVAAAAMGGMLVRMGVIFGGYLVVSRQMPHLLKAGFAPVLGGFFLLTLVLETLFAVRILKHAQPTDKVASQDESSPAANAVGM